MGCWWYFLMPISREYWIIEYLAFSPSYYLGPSPYPPSTLSHQQVVSHSQSSCVSLVELIGRRVGGEGG
jgi:hypothetical protein